MGVGKTSGGYVASWTCARALPLFLSVQSFCVDVDPLAGSRFVSERLNPSGCPGNGSLDEDIRRYYLLSTDLTPLHLVNSGVLEQHAG